jgi:hypothetical protein
LVILILTFSFYQFIVIRYSLPYSNFLLNFIFIESLPNDNIHNNLPTEAIIQNRNLKENRTPTAEPSKPSFKVNPNPPNPSTFKPSFKVTVKPLSSSSPSLIVASKPIKTPEKLNNVPVPSQSFSYPICVKTKGARVNYTNSNMCLPYNNMKAALNNAVTLIGNDQSKLADLYGAAVRLVFHDAIDLDLTKPDLLGADGCISDAAGSIGLIEQISPIFTILEPIYQANCDKINRADFFVLFGKLVIEKAEPTNTIKLQYQYGRKEVTDCSGYAGRDPDPQLGVDTIVQAFIVQLGLNYVDAG